ncbi:TIGR03032 family protein, partial [bacterium]|nr:TIGR03032 family protein [bacterium]
MTDNNIPFGTWQSVYKNLNGRPIAFFGSGNIAEKTLRKIDQTHVKYIYDNATALWNIKNLGIVVINPDEIKKSAIKPYIIITSTSFEEISKQLIKYGLKPTKDFSISPILNDLKIISDLETVKKKMIFTSGAPSSESLQYGGGIYELVVDNDNFNYIKKYSGNVYGMCTFEDNFIAVDIERGIVRLNKKYEVLSNSKLPDGARGHGIQYNEDKTEFYISCSKRDSILVLDKDLNIIDEIFLSNKFKNLAEPSHHCNDCYYNNGFLYVTMFSVSGNWKNDVFDGGIVEIDVNERKINSTLTNKLWMPHNIKKINGGMTVLESLPGRLLANNLQEIGKFSGFTRGLDYDGVFYYIGQSRNRNF